MEIKLNSPKYAEAQSLQYQMYKKQTDRKKRKNFTPELFERYFRRNEGTTDYATIPEVTLSGDFVIEGDFLPASDSDMRIFGEVGLIDNYIRYEGATSKDIVIVGAGFSVRFSGTEIQKSVINSLSISRVGSQYSLIVNGGAAILVTGSLDSIRYDSLYAGNSFQNLAGILANLKIWDNGTLIRDYPLDDNSDDLRELASGQNGTVINGNASDWGLFQQQATGEWLGQELVPHPINFNSIWNDRGATVLPSGDSYITNTSGGEGRSFPHGKAGLRLRFDFDIVCEDSTWQLADWAQGGSNDGTIFNASSNSQAEIIDYTPSQSGVYLRHFDAAFVTLRAAKFSIKEVLNVA